MRGVAAKDGPGLGEFSVSLIINSYSFGAAPWTPAVLTDLEIWVRHNVGMFEDGGATDPAETSDGVLVWQDQSGSNNHMIDIALSDPPTLDADGSTSYNGSSLRLGSTNSLTLKPATIFVLFRVGSVSGNQGIFSGEEGSLGIDINNTTIRLMHTYSALIGQASGFTLTTDTWTRVIATYDGSGNYEIFVNGSSEDSGTNSRTILNKQSRLGAGPAEWMLGRIAEAGIYTQAIGGGDVTKLDAYLAAVQAGL